MTAGKHSNGADALNPVTTFLVNKENLEQTRVDVGAPPSAEPLQQGQILVRIDRFAFTTNNITYAIAGDNLGYWKFFPAPVPWGCVPVWGYATVRHSACDWVSEGERLFGFFPMATHNILTPGRGDDHRLTDVTPHRKGLPSAYNTYLRVSHERSLSPDEEAAVMLFRPLFMTSFLIEDLLVEEDFFGAEAVVLISASSKTAIGVAHLLSQRANRKVEIIGLTSPRNRGFVEDLGFYDRVVTYDRLTQDLPKARVALVDMAGNADVLETLHTHYGEGVLYSGIVGASHGEIKAMGQGLAGARPTFFFAPDRIKKRVADWGNEGLEEHFRQVWGPFADLARRWLTVEYAMGVDAVKQVYLEVLKGDATPDKGHILSLWDA